jgi:uncharacterized protein
MAKSLPIPLPQPQLAEFCKEHGVQKMWLYGSVLTENFGPDSDVDVLVEFQDGIKPDWSYFTWNEELEPLWGRKVDLSTPQDFRPSRRAEILARARLIYEQ